MIEIAQNLLVPDEIVMNKIFLLRGQKVMIDEDLAELYGVPTKRLNEQVKRNIDRFPKDFMFQLTNDEFINLKSQFATSSWGGRRALPYAFTEHGVLMLSSVLNSDRAIKVNIQIMRIYVRIREMITLNAEILQRLEEMESKLSKNDQKVMAIFDYLKQFEALKQQQEKYKNRTRIGYKK